MKKVQLTLRSKTLLFIGVTLACLIVFLYSTSSAILISGFAHVEEQDTQKNVIRAHEAMLDDIAQLSTMTRDWAWWDDTYGFIEDANPDYIRANPTDETLAGLRVNYMLFMNSSGGVVFGKGFDLKSRKEVPVPESFLELLTPGSPLLQHRETRSNLTGIVLLPQGPMLMSSYPILTSGWEGPSRGSLIFARYLDASEIRRLAGITHLSLELMHFNDAQMPSDFAAVRSPLAGGTQIIVRPLSEQSIAGYILLKDVYGNPALIMRVEMPREIYNQGQMSVNYLFLSLIAVGLVFGGMSLWLLERLVLSRLARLNSDVTDIGKSAELSRRVELEGGDELSNLGGAINNMLTALEQAQKERHRAEEELKKHRDHLEELVEERTAELRSINIRLRIENEERKKAEEELKQSEEKYRSLVESTDDSIYMVDRDCNYLFINTKHRARIGIGSYPGRKYSDCHHAEETDRFEARVAHVFETGMPEQQEHEQRERWYLRTFSPVKDPKTRRVSAVTVVSTDITARKKTEEIRIENERLASANKTKSEFLANMSHELRTPLNSIIGFTDLLKQRAPGELNKKQERYIDNVLTSSKFLLNLINDVLDLSKVEAGKIELVMEKISIREIIDESLTLVKERAAKHNVHLKKELDADLDVIEADKLRLKQILFNLLSNAVKFSKKEGGTVTITTTKEGDMARIAVSDTGIGIRSEDMGKLFKEFGQVDPNISVKYGGTGLGLAISKKLVELHGGRIWAESRYGEGSTFTFTMPLTQKR